MNYLLYLLFCCSNCGFCYIAGLHFIHDVLYTMCFLGVNSHVQILSFWLAGTLWRSRESVSKSVDLLILIFTSRLISVMKATHVGWLFVAPRARKGDNGISWGAGLPWMLTAGIAFTQTICRCFFSPSRSDTYWSMWDLAWISWAEWTVIKFKLGSLTKMTKKLR